MTRIIEYWRLFEESVIVFANRFQNNLFLKTQVAFTTALFLICVANLISLAMLAHYVSEGTLDTIFSTWGTALVEEIPAPAFTILELQDEVERVQEHYFLIVGTLNVLAILLLWIATSKVALEPTRDAISAQQNFIAHTAHELRTPLSVARTNIEVTLLDAETIDKDTCVAELRGVLSELDALAGIINNLVMLNSITNFAPAEYHYHDLHEIAEEVVKSQQVFAARKSITLAVESTPDLLVWSNRNALKQMLGNIVGNAINFTPEGGTVLVRVHQLSPRYMRLTVKDSGIGIAKEELQYVFKPFYRSPAVQSRDDGGSGLGLAIVRELVRLHLGRISIQSELEKGTTVLIDLPIIKRRGRFTRSRDKTETAHSISFNYSRDKRTDDF